MLLLGRPVRDASIGILDEGSLESWHAFIDLMDLGVRDGLSVTIKCKADVYRVHAIQLK
jgi:hypothetical protein